MISQAPPIPDVYTTDGQLLFTGAIHHRWAGRLAIDRRPGDWHGLGSRRVRRSRLERRLAASRVGDSAQHIGRQRDGARDFAALNPDQQAVFKARLIREMRTNTYDAAHNRVTRR